MTSILHNHTDDLYEAKDAAIAIRAVLEETTTTAGILHNSFMTRPWTLERSIRVVSPFVGVFLGSYRIQATIGQNIFLALTGELLVDV